MPGSPACACLPRARQAHPDHLHQIDFSSCMVTAESSYLLGVHWFPFPGNVVCRSSLCSLINSAALPVLSIKLFFYNTYNSRPLLLRVLPMRQNCPLLRNLPDALVDGQTVTSGKTEITISTVSTKQFFSAGSFSRFTASTNAYCSPKSWLFSIRGTLWTVDTNAWL